MINVFKLDQVLLKMAKNPTFERFVRIFKNFFAPQKEKFSLLLCPTPFDAGAAIKNSILVCSARLVDDQKILTSS